MVEVTEEGKAAVIVKDVAGLSASPALVLFKVKVICESGSSINKSASCTVYPSALPVNLMNSAPSAEVSETGVMVMSEEFAVREPEGMVTVTVEVVGERV